MYEPKYFMFLTKIQQSWLLMDIQCWEWEKEMLWYLYILHEVWLLFSIFLSKLQPANSQETLL